MQTSSKSSSHIELVYIDHYDSFSRNVIDWLSIDSEVFVRVVNCENSELLQDLTNDPRPLIFSPGPKAPQNYPQSLQIMHAMLGKVPLLGICLGHQMLGAIRGFKLTQSDHTFHGMTKSIRLSDPSDQIFKGLPQSFDAMSYNSLVLQGSSPEIIAATTEGEIQAIRMSNGFATAWGIQFHPESFKSNDLSLIAKNFVDVCRSWKANV